MIYKKPLVVSLCALAFNTTHSHAMSWNLCPGGIDRSAMTIEETQSNQHMRYLSFSPKLTGQALKIQGVQTSIIAMYNGSCEIFNGANVNGVQVNLLDSGESYDGSGLSFHQLVYGGDGNDIIMTGKATDYVYGQGGNDQIFTSDDYEKVDGGAGADCVEQGNQGQIQSAITTVEATSCAGYAPSNCTGLGSNITLATNTSYNPHMTYLSVTPQDSSISLTAEGSAQQVILYYDNQCEVIEADAYSGVMVNLTDSGATYDGSNLNFHQLVIGGNGDDTIHTGDKVDYIYGNGGNDTIYSNADYDRIDGGTGVDCAEEGASANITSPISNVEYQSCANTIDTVDIDDLPTNLASQYVKCNTQDYGFYAQLNNGTWQLEAMDSNVTIHMAEYGDYTFAYSTNYQHCELHDRATDITVILSDGNDKLYASTLTKNMTVYGKDGKDTIQTGSGHDLIFGGNASDSISSGNGNDWISGGSKIATDHDGLVHSAAHGGAASDSSDNINAGNGNDVIFGNGGSDKIQGGNGDDVMFGNNGKADRLYGNSGADLIVDSGGYSWGNRAKAWGGSGQDIIICEAGQCELNGGGSKDFLATIATNSNIGLYGGNGGDILFVRGDSLPLGTGGSGNDFCYNEWNDRDVCDYLSSAKKKSGYFDTAVRKAASGMSSRHEQTLKMSNFSEQRGYSTFKQRIADLVNGKTFNAWQSNRSKSIYDLQ
ncbi:calcium-binding protein [Pseudoalteromonas luteoviolacea]|nr:calcium-binding protein [Pseudoalteromonas luteoviolacea]